MNPHCPDGTCHAEGRPRCPRCFGPPIFAVTIVAAVVLVLAGAVAYRNLDDRIASLEARTTPTVDLSGINVRLDSAESHIANLARASFGHRDELRKEVADGEKRLGRSIAALVATDSLYRVELDAARRQHAEDVREIRERLNGLTKKLSEAWRSIAELAGKIAGLESRPTPERVIVERRVEVPVYLYPIMPVRYCR